MTRLCYAAAVLFMLLTVAPFFADDKKADNKKDDSFVPMFNGKDLTGWVNVNCAPCTFYVKDNEIITTGKPTGYLRTEKQYENFVAEFEWMHVPPKPGEVGNSGFFVWADPLPAVGTGYTRGIEVQVLVNLTHKNKKGEITATSQGDLFSIHGATCVPDRPHPDGWARCLPSENHCKGEKEWNHYRVEAKDGRITLTVNGHEVSGVSKCRPRKGYLALESEGSECHFRNLKIKELPSTNPKPEECADVAQGHKQLYTGLDLSGWKAEDEAKKHWQPDDWKLVYDGKGEKGAAELRTEKEYGDAEFIVDYRVVGKKEGGGCMFVLREGGGEGKDVFTTSRYPSPPGKWYRVRVALRGDTMQLLTDDGKVHKEIKVKVPGEKGAFVLRPHSGMEFGNLFVRELEK